MGMETVLNLVWALLAALMFSLWLRFAPRIGPSRRGDSPKMQFVALAVMILLLFPVISVTDDLQAIQNPAETDSCQRRDQVCSTPHSIFPAVAALPLPAFSGLSFAYFPMQAPSNLPAPVVASPALASIENRPPPAA
jgi:hypothetical protein